ncbi:hypothetical protein HK096_004857, partial [Nowakowskiella sp. JEL0078]
MNENKSTYGGSSMQDQIRTVLLQRVTHDAQNIQRKQVELGMALFDQAQSDGLGDPHIAGPVPPQVQQQLFVQISANLQQLVALGVGIEQQLLQVAVVGAFLARLFGVDAVDQLDMVDAAAAPQRCVHGWVSACQSRLSSNGV